MFLCFHCHSSFEEGAVSFLLQHANDDFTKQNWNFIELVNFLAFSMMA